MIKRILFAIGTAVVMMLMALSIIGLMSWGIDSVVFDVKFYTGLPVRTVWILIGILTAIVAVIVYICITKDERKK